MATLKLINGNSRSGRKYLDRLVRRGEGMLDGKMLTKVERIIGRVRRGGDRALVDAVKRFDGVAVKSIQDLRLTASVGEDNALPAGFEQALERAISAVEAYHKLQVHEGFSVEEGGILWQEHRLPLRRVGVYVPGGRAAYPSTAVMTVVPALAAGVSEIAVATPPAAWERNAALRHTLERLGVSEIWGMGGAHAVAALAYGTESLERVDKIVGPGNAFVTGAKKLVMGDVAIDSLAGPSEVVIGVGGEANPECVAADLLAQAEHDPLALSVLVTDNKALAKAVVKAVDRQLPDLPTRRVAKESLSAQGGAVVVDDLEAILTWIDAIAPEHLQLMGTAEALADRVRNAGATFVGEATPVVFGDYIAGPSHVLPTNGTARFASALGVEDFIRRSHVVRYSDGASQRSAAAAANLADVEGLYAHAAAARLRQDPSS